MSDARRLSSEIQLGLARLNPSLSKPILRKLSGATSAVIESKSVNTNEIASCLPIDTDVMEHRWQWLHRLLRNPLVVESEVLGPLNVALLKAVYVAEQGRHAGIELCIDQTSIRGKVGVEQEVVMVSLRVEGRGYPLAWQVRLGAGNIGHEAYEVLLGQVSQWLEQASIKPEDVMLLGDRFYGSVALIRQCQQLRWQYRLRLRQDLNLDAGLWCGKTGELANIEERKRDNLLKNKVLLTESECQTYVGFLHEAGHPEPWIIALDAPPTQVRIRQYGHRWSIEALFSDLKTRNFGLEQSQIQHPDRLGRLILLLALAIWWLIRIGLETKKKEADSP